MALRPEQVRRIALATLCASLALGSASSIAQTPQSRSNPIDLRVIEVRGTVEVLPAGANTWVLTQTNQLLHPGDQLRTGADSRASLLSPNQGVERFGALTTIEILPPHQPG